MFTVWIVFNKNLISHNSLPLSSSVAAEAAGSGHRPLRSCHVSIWWVPFACGILHLPFKLLILDPTVQINQKWPTIPRKSPRPRHNPIAGTI
uniref:ELL-associated factor 1 n=1 Tax=Rhizophora mucronata TaxID=61149 RepID=A0A2P2IW43_RHIMU